MSNSEIKIENNEVEKSITDGLWKTDKGYIKISEIEDIEYLQKILFTLQSREKKTIFNYIKNMDIIASLIIHVLNRREELGCELKLKFEPIKYTLNDRELNDQKSYIKEKINQ